MLQVLRGDFEMVARKGGRDEVISAMVENKKRRGAFIGASSVAMAEKEE